MKGLRHFTTLLLLCSIAIASQRQPKELEAYISELKRKEFRYDHEKNVLESKKLRDSWIAPLQLNYRYNTSNPYDNEQTTKNASIAIQQPIFRSGGIYYGIKFAQASRKFQNLSIEMQKRKLVKEAIALLMQIKQSDLRIKKQHLQIENAKIKLHQNKEEYLAGNLESGFLDNSIIQLNLTKQALFEMEATKEKLVSKFKALSDIDYKTAYIPRLDRLTKKQFLAHNTLLEQLRSQNERERYRENVTLAKYLPSVSLTASYNRDEISNPSFAGTSVPSPPPTNYYSYGFTISMPLDFNSLRDIQSAKIDRLKSNIMIKDKKRELIALYEQVSQNIETIQKKIALAHENFTLYQKLLEDTQKLYEAGEKTSYDVDLLRNSKDMAQIDEAIYDIDKQLELLNLYEYYDAI